MHKRLTALCLACCCLFHGCAGEAVVSEKQSRVEIALSWWGNDARTEYTIAGVRRFEELHPEIKVRVSYSEWSGYEARNRIQMASATEADVMQINFGWLSEFSPDGKGYYDIGTLGDIVDFSNYDEPILAYGRSGGVLNAVPIAMNAETVYINKSVYDAYGLDIPETWEDFERAAAVMAPDGIYPLAGPSKSIWLMTIAYAEQMTGTTFLREDGKLNFTPHELGIMIGFYARMIEKKVFPPVEYFDRLNIDNGTYAGCVAWVSDAGNYFNRAMQNGSEVVAAPYPHDAEHSSGEGWYVKPASLYAVSRNTEHPREAAMLLDFLLNDPDMAVLQGVEKGVPLSRSARETLRRKDMLQGLQFEASLHMNHNEHLGLMNPYIEQPELVEQFVLSCDQVVFDMASPEKTAMQLYLGIRRRS